MTQAAGKLNHRIRLESLETSQDANGETVETWTHEGDVWANVSPVSGKEFISSAAMQSQIVARITVRYRSDIQATWRILFRNRYYNIEAVLADVVSGLEYLTLPCSLGVIADVVIQPQEVQPPDGYDWNPPLAVYRLDNTFTTDFNADDWKIAATADLWVSTTGNDTTGNGSQAFPYRTFLKAWQSANGLAAANINIFVGAGLYNRQQINGNGVASDGNKNINVIAVGGRAVFSSHFEPLTWTSIGSGTSSAPRTNVVTVRDAAFPLPDGTLSKLILASSIANCQATAGSWFTNGTTVYVHPIDGRAIDANIRVYALVTNTLVNNAKQYYFEGIDFEGGNDGAMRWSGAYLSTRRIVFNDCRFRYGSGTSGNGLSATVGALVIANNCTAERNDQDGFNYHQTTLGNFGFVEIGCIGRNNGLAGDDDNGSTSHEQVTGLRVNCAYSTNIGPLCADVNDAQTWNLGVSCQDSLGSGINNAGFISGNAAGHRTKVWIDTCSASGSTYATNTSDFGIIYRRLGSLSGIISGNVENY